MSRKREYEVRIFANRTVTTTVTIDASSPRAALTAARKLLDDEGIAAFDWEEGEIDYADTFETEGSDGKTHATEVARP